MRQPVTIHPSFYQSPSVLALPEECRALIPHDWACSEPDSYGCFMFNPRVIWIQQRGIQPSQQLVDVEHRLALYRGSPEPMLEVWIEGGREYGHWVGWFKPVLGTRNKRLLNGYDPSKMGARRTPIPPSLRPWEGDPRRVEDWTDVVRNAARTNREAPSLNPGSTFPIPSLFQGSTVPETREAPSLNNREASSSASASATATAPSDARERARDGGGGSPSDGGSDSDGSDPSNAQRGSESLDPRPGRVMDPTEPGSSNGGAAAASGAQETPSPGGAIPVLPPESNNRKPLATIDAGVSRGTSDCTERPPGMTRAELVERMRVEWRRVSGSSGTGFTDQDLSGAVDEFRGHGTSAAEILEAWGWFLRHGPDGLARRNLQAATPLNFLRFGWQAWVAHRTAGPPSHQPAPQVIPEGPPDFQFPPGAKEALQSLYGRNEPEEIIQ